jgi:hypothetical protein
MGGDGKTAQQLFSLAPASVTKESEMKLDEKQLKTLGL